MEKVIARDQWTLIVMKDVTMDQFWNCVKLDGVNASRCVYLDSDSCLNSEKEVWFDSGKIIWNKQWRVFQEHIKYIHNDIVKPFRGSILQYPECTHEIHYILNHFPPHQMKGAGLGRLQQIM